MPDTRNWQRILKIEDLGDEVRVEVSYYSDQHHRKIQKSLPSRKGHLPKHGEVITIPTSEFLTYWLFESKNPADPLFSDFEALSKLVQAALPDLMSDFEHSENHLRALAKPPGSERAGDISTRLGVAVGLAVTNKMLGLTRADWMKLPKTYAGDGTEQPRMDYALTTTADGYVALENKGNIITTDNRLKPPAVSGQLASIRKKKKFVRKTQKDMPLLAAIAVADSRDDSTLKCWLLDPPQDLPTDLDPVLFRLIARLSYYGGLLRCVFPRSKGLFDDLKSRIRVLSLAKDWRRYSGSNLRYQSNQPIRANWKAGRKVHATSQTNGLWVGVLKPCGYDHLLFIGVSQKWVELILNQDLNQLIEIATKPISEKVMLQCEVTDRGLKKLDPWLSNHARVDYREGDSTHSVQLPAMVHQTSSGFAFALIKK